MSSNEGNFLGDSRLGESKLGPVSETPGELTSARTPRDRFSDWLKSAFPDDDGTTWDDFLETLADEFNTELSVRQNLWLQQYVDSATDAQLEKIGEGLFRLPRRSGEPDPLYRRRIKLQLPKFTSGATIDDILGLSAHLLGCDPTDIELVEEFDTEPARFDIFINEQIVNSVPISVDQYEDLLQSIKAAGVKANATIGAQFTYRSEYEYTNNINDPSRGYASEDGSVEGAPYADIITAAHRTPADDPELTVGLVGFGEDGFGTDGFGA